MTLSEYIMSVIERAQAQGKKVMAIQVSPRDYTALCVVMGSEAHTFCGIPVTSNINVRIGDIHVTTQEVPV